MMPENDNSSPPTVPSPPASSRPVRRNPWFFVALAALALAGWQWLETRQLLQATQQEVSRRLAEADAGNSEDRGAQKALREQLEALQTKLGAVEGRLGEFEGQGESLRGLVQDLTRSREEASLLEVEQAITLAGQQLQLAGNVPVAVLALQSADTRLARLDRPQYLPLRKALAKDLERLSAVPFVDVPGISLRLEQIIVAVDKLPLAAYGRPGEKAEKAAPADPAKGGASPSWWQRTVGEIWQEVRGLVRIQRFDKPEPALLAPGQDFFLRENLKLRLLNARLALLNREQATFRSELKVAQDWLARHFVGDDKGVQAAMASLKPLQAAELNAELPALNDTQAALRAIRSGKDKR